MDKRAIGVFDSGLGGLTVVHEITKALPNESIVYLGDTARVPYGTRSGELVREFSFEDADFLLRRNVKCIVIACNTSSAYASEALKKRLNLPVFEVINPPSRKAATTSKGRRIGVIATRGTIASGAYERAIHKISPKEKVFSQACPLLVPFVEEGEFGPSLDKVIEKYLSSLKGRIDTLILGCTHYPIIEGKIRKYLGKKVLFINPGHEAAQELKEYLEKRNMFSNNKNPKRQYFVTDLTRRFIKVAEMFLGEKVDGKIKKVDIKK